VTLYLLFGQPLEVRVFAESLAVFTTCSPAFVGRVDLPKYVSLIDTR
jgi:hypothetical protein